jgi:DNA-binding NtrC family response regulator
VRGNKAVAARLLGVSRRAFYRQLERHGLHTTTPTVKPAPAAPIVPLGRVS